MGGYLKMDKKEILKNGIFKSNPIFVLLLGLCSVLAVTYDVDNAIAMGVAMIFVLVLSNFMISLIRKFIPHQMRLPIFIVIIASLVTCVTLLMEAFAYDLFVSLGVFLPLMTVNCIIFARAEAFAVKNSVLDSVLDGVANGVGYLLALLIISFIREGLGTGIIEISNPFNQSQVLLSTERMWNFFGGLINSSNPTFINDFFVNHSIPILVEPIGAFICLAFIIALFTLVNKKREEKLKKGSE